MIKKILPKEEFNNLQGEISLKKLAQAINDLQSSLKQDDHVSPLIEKTNQLLADLIAGSKKEAKEYGPDIINELRRNTEAIVQLVKPEEKPVEQPKEWKFTVKRGITGVIEEITAKQI